MSGIAAAALAAVGFGALSVSSSGSQSVRTPPAGHSDDRVAATTTTEVPAVPTPGATDDRGADGAGATSSPASTGTGTGPSSSPTGSSGAATASTTPSAGTTTTYDSGSEGGSITVHFVDGVVSLISSTPTAGYTASVHDNGPTRVEVRFAAGEGEWRIRIDVVKGELVPEISHHGS